MTQLTTTEVAGLYPTLTAKEVIKATEQLTNHAEVVQLDVLISELAQRITDLEAAIIRRAELTGDNYYRGFKVIKRNGCMSVEADQDALKQPPAPKPACAKNAQVEVKVIQPAAPVPAPQTYAAKVGHGSLTLLTVDYVLESMKREAAQKHDMEAMLP